MKKIVLAIAAVAMLAAPVAAQAGPRDHGRNDARMTQKHVGPAHSSRKVNRHVVIKKQVVKPRWVRGHRVPAWQRSHVVRDYHRYGLRRPGHGQQWVKVGNDYLLVALTSGIIASIIAGR
jgi:Ni/Co efflux regulator RcnB